VKGSRQEVNFCNWYQDIIPDIPGYADAGRFCSSLPLCHGYEVRNEKTGVIGNGELV